MLPVLILGALGIGGSAHYATDGKSTQAVGTALANGFSALTKGGAKTVVEPTVQSTLNQAFGEGDAEKKLAKEVAEKAVDDPAGAADLVLSNLDKISVTGLIGMVAGGLLASQVVGSFLPTEGAASYLKWPLIFGISMFAGRLTTKLMDKGKEYALGSPEQTKIETALTEGQKQADATFAEIKPELDKNPNLTRRGQSTSAAPAAVNPEPAEPSIG